MWRTKKQRARRRAHKVWTLLLSGFQERNHHSAVVQLPAARYQRLP